MTKIHPTLLFGTLLLALVACVQDTAADLEKWKGEVVATEKAFNDMAQEKGLMEAFAFFAADSGVIRRGRNIIKGKSAIGAFYEKSARPDETLTWRPTFVDVSESGDLAYTYGDYEFIYFDTLGNEQINKGIFHTVWKRQTDGTWRFVWD